MRIRLRYRPAFVFIHAFYRFAAVKLGRRPDVFVTRDSIGGMEILISQMEHLSSCDAASVARAWECGPHKLSVQRSGPQLVDLRRVGGSSDWTVSLHPYVLGDLIHGCTVEDVHRILPPEIARGVLKNIVETDINAKDPRSDRQ